jgi:autophagy-related protein 11
LLKSSALASETNSLKAVAPDSPAGMSPVQAGPLSSGQLQLGGTEAQKGASGNEGTSPQTGGSSVQGAAGKSSEVRNVDSLLGP